MTTSLRFLGGVFVLLFMTSPLSAQRYLSEIFAGFDSTANIVYANNISVLTGSPQPSALKMDVYEPMGDASTMRPLIIMCHTGSFLPAVANGQPTGGRTDSTQVEMAKQFARRGYVVACMSNRLGWNPFGSTVDIRTGTLLNAAYRGIQDFRSCVRYFRRSVAESGNPFGIDPNMIIAGGVGTGGYIVFGANSLDKVSEIQIAKFIDGGTGQPYVNPAVNGNFDGTDSTLLSRPNHVGYSSDIQFCFNLGGAIGDSTWLEAGDAPMVGFHCTKDPFAPYEYGQVIVPTTGQFVVNVSGTYGVLRRANQLGNNNGMIAGVASLNDPYTLRANAINNGNEGMFPIITPAPATPTVTCPLAAYPTFEQGSPWDWWNETWYGAAITAGGGDGPDGVCKARLGNPDMSPTKGRKYIDSIMQYLNPRIYYTLGLTDVKDAINKDLKVFPNPATSFVRIKSSVDKMILGVEIMDVTGRIVRKEDGLRTNEYVLERNGLASGMYLVKMTFADGEGVGKLWFQ